VIITGTTIGATEVQPITGQEMADLGPLGNQAIKDAPQSVNGRSRGPDRQPAGPIGERRPALICRRLKSGTSRASKCHAPQSRGFQGSVVQNTWIDGLNVIGDHGHAGGIPFGHTGSERARRIVVRTAKPRPVCSNYNPEAGRRIRPLLRLIGSYDSPVQNLYARKVFRRHGPWVPITFSPSIQVFCTTLPWKPRDCGRDTSKPLLVPDFKPTADSAGRRSPIGPAG